MSDDPTKIPPRLEIEPWQKEIYDFLKATKAEINFITGVAYTSMGVDIGREGGDETTIALVDFNAIQDQILGDVFSDAALYGRGYSKSMLQNEILRQQYLPHTNIHPPFVILDEWGDIPKAQYLIDPDYTPDRDGPTSRKWTQPIPNPQAPKPVSSPSSTKRAKLRAKRKRKA